MLKRTDLPSGLRMSLSRSALSRYFWPAQLGAWGLYALQQYLGGVGLIGGKTPYHLLSVADAAIGCLFTLLLREVFKRTWTAPPLTRIAWGVGALSVTGIAYGVLWAQVVAGMCATCRVPQNWLGYVSYFGGASTLLLAWSGGYLGIKLAHQAQQAREQALHAIAIAQQAQLRMLRYQLNPHFLFNALTTLSTRMIERDDEEGERVVDALAGFLRYSLDSDPEQGVALEEELAAMRRYLAIEQARFGERLRVHYDIAADVLAARVPSLILQPLVENAIKHAVAPSIAGGSIDIAARREDDMLVIAVDDDGPGSDDYGGPANGGDTAARGIGLRNVSERLRVMYGARQRFAVQRRTPKGTRARLHIPFETIGATTP